MGQEQQRFPIMLGFSVADMQKSLAFYRNQLGFALAECWPDEKAPQWASLTLAGQTIMLGQSMPAETCEKMHAKNPAAGEFWGRQAAKFAEHPHGAGVVTYLLVDDVDGYAQQLARRGVRVDLPPTTQFYGLRDLVVTDPDGYVLTFYKPVKMESCQSCGMPLTSAEPGDMYCSHCVDDKGRLRPYEQVFEGTVTGYFMAHQKLARPQAEKAAREHLAKMPAWAARK